MPPSMSAHDDDALPLSNEDIETLYEIVRHAQTLPGPPFHSLFQAYDTILAQKRINPDNDQIYLRFLFRMQDRANGTTGGLLESFQRVLADLDIQVEIDPEGEGIEEVTRDVTAPPVQRDTGHTQAAGLGAQRHITRTGSFDSFFDGTADKVPGPDALSERSGKRRGSHGEFEQRRDKRRSRSQTEARADLLGRLPIRSRVNGNYNQRTLSDNLPIRARRNGSVSSLGSDRINYTRNSATTQPRDYDGDESEQTDSFERSQIQIPGVNAPIPGSHLAPVQQYVPADMQQRPSDTQMLDEADVFEDTRIKATARKCWKTWLDRTREATDSREEMQVRAYAFDRRILLKASLDSWQIAYQNRRQAQETERFFERLETRAGKARNLFLLTKAFTHWAKSAEDEVLRTSVAKRHMIRTKYFNAWRDITAVNELKIQHFVLGKFLAKWRFRTAAIREKAYLAVTLYTENLVFKVYWRWFWTFCERRAPVWSENRLKKTIVERWVEIVGVLRERERWAENRRNRDLLHTAFVGLMEKLTRTRNSHTRADDFRRRSLLSTAFHSIRRKVTYSPLMAGFKQGVDTRVLGTTLQIWHRNAHLSRQASSVDRMRVLRNAWTAWNDRLRMQALAVQINDRVLIESLYRWALASRVSLFKRVHDRTLKETLFSTWVQRSRERQANLEDAERRFARFKRAQMLRGAMQRIEQAVVERRGLEYLARSVYEPKVKQAIFGTLLQRHRHLQQLNTWAGDARFYVLTTHTIKQWQDATGHARRSRRREAYVHVRRTVKMNLVRRTFILWRDRAAQLAHQNQQAVELDENRALRASTVVFGHWKNRTASINTMEVEATQSRKTNLSSTTLSLWHERSEFLRAMDNQANALRQESTEIAASSSLKKLGWRLWTVQRQEETALALHQRNFHKHIRAMLRFWFDQAAERAARRPISPTPSSRRLRRDDDDNDGSDGHDGNDGEKENNPEQETGDAFEELGDVTRRLESWTAFDPSGLGLTPPTNLDLSFSALPSRNQPFPPSSRQPSATSQHPKLPHRPHTQPPTLFSSRPPPIPETEAEDDDDDLGDMWTSTPMPPLAKPGYLKTPSKRSVARAKRPELPTSPEKRTAILDRSGLGAGAMSAPPAPGGRGVATQGVTSFERRLRDGGFGRSMVRGGARGFGRSTRDSAKGKGKVGFSDVYE
ncbi:Sfi1-domain-containing protein [Polyplosphaeria fusca]|uniref:Sfi1-domain-containing protein n=1 Tax=Polyplosphaeria fusca TaxID=682080 RepID=A0A9P4R8Q4_9PLEO|nr:Sfi1-domain-containing protein [Polyplosphaeria fusca]